jgi:hypothetical protein
MGFMTGVITGITLAAAAAAWYMSRSGERFRDQYRVDRKLGELGDQLEARTREIQASVNAQLADLRARNQNGSGGTHDAIGSADATLDAAAASAAEAAAEVAAEVETKAAKVRRKAERASED